MTITDTLSDTSLPGTESFTTIKGPTYGTAYRGVAFICNQRDSNNVCTLGRAEGRG